MIPRPKFGGDIGEAASETLVEHVRWGQMENDEEKTNVNGNSNIVDSDDDRDAQGIISTSEESGSEGYSTLEEEPVGSATMSVYTQEGIAVARRIWGQFWSPEYKHFRTQEKTAETVRWPWGS